MEDDLKTQSPNRAEETSRQNSEPAAASGKGSVSREKVSELRFEFLKQIGTLALGSAGGAVTLLRTVYGGVEDKSSAIIAIVLLVGAAVLSLMAQQYLIERLGEEIESEGSEYLLPKMLMIPRTRRLERVVQTIAVLMLSIGVGLFGGFAISAW